MSTLYFLYIAGPYPMDVGMSFYLFCTLLGLHSLGMAMSYVCFTFPLCVLAICSRGVRGSVGAVFLPNLLLN